MASIIHGKTGEPFVSVTGSRRLEAALQVIGEASVSTTGGEALNVFKVDGQLVALDPADSLTVKLRQYRKGNSGHPVAAKPAAPWYRRFDKR